MPEAQKDPAPPQATSPCGLPRRATRPWLLHGPLLLLLALCALALLPCTALPANALALAAPLVVAVLAQVLVLRRATVRAATLEQKHPGHENLQSELRQALMSLDNAGDMIFWSRVEDARVCYANQAACDILGYTREELLSLTVPDLNPGRTIESWRRLCAELRVNARLTSEMSFLCKDGRLIPVESTAALVMKDGAEYGMGIARDITQRKALEAELKQAQVSIDNTQDMVLWLRMRDKRIAYANRAACAALGYTREEILGVEARRINVTRVETDWAAARETILQAGWMLYDADYRRKDGSVFPVEVNAFLQMHEGEEYAIGIVRDITQRKEAENRLKQEMHLNRTLAEAARALISPQPDTDAIASLLLDRAMEITGSAHGYLAFINQQTRALELRATSPSMKDGGCGLGIAMPTVFPCLENGGYHELWGHSLNTREPLIENNPGTHPRAFPLPRGHAPIHQMLSIPALVKGRLVGQITLANPGRDYTRADLDAVVSLADLFALGADQILSQQALVEAKEKAESSSRAKGDFLANMTHEVRTPLNGVLGMLQVLQNTTLTPDQHEYVDVALESAERLHLLLGNVIEYARLDASGRGPDMMLFPLADLLNSLRATYEPLAARKRLRFTVQAEADLPELVRTDPQALRQALSKLLDNAIKFTPTGSVELAAAMIQTGRGMLEFRVADTGIGIPKEKREQVFEAFVQADASFTRTFGGAGLGLAITRKLMRQLGGTVEALERPGGGTVMRLTIPVDGTDGPEREPTEGILL